MKKDHIWTKKLTNMVGKERCCCDGKHHVVESVDQDTGDIVTKEGKRFSAWHCTEPVHPLGLCHTYLDKPVYRPISEKWVG